MNVETNGEPSAAIRSDSEFFLKCTGNNNQRGRGTCGKNGADYQSEKPSQLLSQRIAENSRIITDCHSRNMQSYTI